MLSSSKPYTILLTIRSTPMFKEFYLEGRILLTHTQQIYKLLTIEEYKNLVQKIYKLLVS